MYYVYGNKIIVIIIVIAIIIRQDTDCSWKP